MTTRERVRELRREGLVYREIAERLGISMSHAKHCGLSDASYERFLRSSRTAKQRRTGTCEICGSETRYSGQDPAISNRCSLCANRTNGKERRGTGPVVEAVLTLLRTGDALRYIDLREAIVAAGGEPSGISALLYQRLIPYGFARRIARGVYVAGPALTNGKPDAT